MPSTTSVGSPDLRELLDRARGIAAEVVATHADREDEEAAWPEPAMRALAEAGLMGLVVPREAGGHGLGISALVEVTEILARESGSVALCYAMHNVGTAAIAARASEEQKERYLEPIARGEHLTTLALSEPGTGIHFYLPETRLTHAGDAYVLDGTKSFVTNGGHADSYVVSTRAVDGSEDKETFSCLVVDADAPGLAWRSEWSGLGMRANSSRTMDLRGVRVPADHLLGREGDQLWYMFEVIVPFFVVAMAGTYLGIADGAFELARGHLGSRRHSHSGELLGAAPVLSHRLGEMWIRLQSARQLVRWAARLAESGDEALQAIFASKAVAADTAVYVANEAMTLMGGIGYREKGKMARLLHDARAAHVMAPPTDLLKTAIGRVLLDLPVI